MDPLFALAVPWGLFGVSAEERRDRHLLGRGPARLSASMPILLASPQTKHLRLGGRRRALQAEGRPFSWVGHGDYVLWLASVGVKPEERWLAVTDAEANTVGEIEA